MKYIPLYILEKIARREEQKINELRQRLRLPTPQPLEPLPENEEDAETPYKPIIIDMS
jgi:hypothetical protein